MNLVVMMGRLTNDPDIRSGQDGRQIARYTLAVDRRGRDSGADFVRCVCFDRAADFAERFLHKGTKIGVIGRIRTDSYEDRQTGKKIYTTEVVVNEHHFCESRSDARNGGLNGSNDDRQGNNRPMQNEGFEAVSEGIEGLPFN